MLNKIRELLNIFEEENTILKDCVLIKVTEGSGWYQNKVGQVFVAIKHQTSHDESLSYFNIANPQNTLDSKPLIMEKHVEIIQGKIEQISF